MTMEPVDRRTFLSLCGGICAAALVPAPAAAAPGPVLRTLGRTGLKVSQVGMGVMLTTDPAVVRAALDQGVTYFDTARSYGGGRNEQILADGLGERRRDVVVATKCHRLGRKESVVASAEESLRALRTDVIDVFQLHGLSARRDVLLPEHLEALEGLRKSGKIRFAGVTTHSGMETVLAAAVEAGVYDVVLTSFNFSVGREVLDAAAAAAKAGIGVVAMKVMAGGYSVPAIPGLNSYQSAIAWTLKQPGIATAIPSMTTIEQARQDCEVMGRTWSLRDDVALSIYAAATEGRYCRACGSCAGACPNGADVPLALRALMYAEGYRRPDLAAEALAGCEPPCASCPGCTVRCRFGLPVGERMALASELPRRHG